VHGSGNTAVGNGAGASATSDGGVFIGEEAGDDVTTANNVICIGALGANTNNSCFIGNISGATATGGAAVFVTSGNKLGTVTSSRRFKDAIKPMDKASEAIFALKPVTFRYKKELDPDGIQQFGLVAEEVEKVNPALIALDKEGKPYTVRYEQVNAMMLNEFLKEHRKVEEQQATITQLKSTVAQQGKDFQATVAQLTARLDEQAAQIQTVSARLEATKPAPQVVNNP
jgi:Chaperone of endosialidase